MYIVQYISNAHVMSNSTIKYPYLEQIYDQHFFSLLSLKFQIKIMSVQFFPKLSQNYIEILDDDEYYDLTIEVGKDPDVKIFRTHMIILFHFYDELWLSIK